MKAFLLAAGKGTRLRPITDTVPKCLVDICGTPLLSIWFDLLVEAGVTEALINTHHLPEAVRDFVRNKTPSSLKIRLAHEEELVGSAGTIKHNRDFVAGDEEFMVIYADNLSSLSLVDFISYHRRKKSIFTMGLFRADAPKECGIASMDADGRIVKFIEKPKEPESNQANAGIYVMRTSLINDIPDKPLADFGFDLIPGLVGKMYGYPIPDYYIDIGTLERLEKARREWPVKKIRGNHVFNQTGT